MALHRRKGEGLYPPLAVLRAYFTRDKSPAHDPDEWAQLNPTWIEDRGA